MTVLTGLVLSLPFAFSDGTYSEEPSVPARPHSRHGRIRRMSDDETRAAEAALAASTSSGGSGTGGNGSSKIAEALALLLRPVNRAIDELFERVGALEAMQEELRRGHTAIQAHLAQQDQATAAQTATVTQQLEEMQAALTAATKKDEFRWAQVASLDAHRKDHAHEQDVKMDTLAQGQSTLAVELAELKRANEEQARAEHERVRLEEEAKELAARRHVETLAAARDMRNSFNVMTAIFPGVVVWLIQGGLHASLQGFLEGAAVTAVMIGWNFVPAFVRWLRLKFGR